MQRKAGLILKTMSKHQRTLSGGVAMICKLLEKYSNNQIFVGRLEIGYPKPEEQ